MGKTMGGKTMGEAYREGHDEREAQEGFVSMEWRWADTAASRRNADGFVT